MHKKQRVYEFLCLYRYIYDSVDLPVLFVHNWNIECFRSQLDALNIPVFLRVILDRTVRAKLAHLVVKVFDQRPE